MRAGPFPLAGLAEIAGASLGGCADPQVEFDDVAPLSSAGPTHVSFLDNRKYLPDLESSAAGACIVHPDLAGHAPKEMALLLSSAPYKSYALVARAFYPEPKIEAGVARSATVDATAVLGDGTRVEAGAAVGAGAEIGAACLIGANAVIGDGVRIGDGTVVGPNCTLTHCLIGARVTLYPGVRIGQPGFGFAMDPAGHVHVPQLGRVVVEDDVTISANCTVDRGAGPDTVVGAGSVIDNMVHIAHNVRIGRGCVIAGQVGISGSTELGDFVVVAGQAGFAGHLNVGSGAQIGGQSGVLRDVEPRARLMGTPARPLKKFFREIALLERLGKKGSGS